MKFPSRLLPLVVLLSAAAVFAAPKSSGAHATTAHASIHVRGNPRASQRVALAKISFEDAMKAALAASPGKIASGDLEVDEGSLVFDFTIVSATGKAMDVEVDAGNGKVLSVEEGDDD